MPDRNFPAFAAELTTIILNTILQYQQASGMTVEQLLDASKAHLAEQDQFVTDRLKKLGIILADGNNPAPDAK